VARLAKYANYTSIELVKACAGSIDPDAWEEFIRRFHVVIAAAVLRTARHYGETSSSQRDDLIQETYLKLCEDDCRLLRAFQPRQEDSIYGFLKVVAANVVRDHFKSALAVKRGARQTEAVVEPLTIDSATSDSDGFSAISQRIQLEKIDKTLHQVTKGKDQLRNCSIFWLRHRYGLTASEIAAIPSVGLTTEGVESVLMRLTAVIRSHMIGSGSHREVKVLNRQSRSNKRLGT
jgi:RNA polymerase sigma-70 factor (ECF subfamily)